MLASFDSPSTITSTVFPTIARLFAAQISPCTASSSLFRRRFTSSGTSSLNRSIAVVPGRGLYLKIKLFLNRQYFVSSTVFAKSSSVSVGNPTIASLARRNIRHIPARPIDKITILPRRIPPVHHLQNPIRPRLRRHMQIPANPRAVPHRLQRQIRKITRKTRHKPKPRQLRHGLVNLIKQIRKRSLPPIPMLKRIMINRLPQQRHFHARPHRSASALPQ